MAQSDEIYQKVITLWDKADYLWKNNQVDSSLFYYKNALDICKNESLNDILPIAEHLVGLTYHLKNDPNEQFKAIPYLKDAAYRLKDSNQHDDIIMGLTSIEMVSRTYHVFNMQDSVINFINDYAPYLERQKINHEKSVLEILYWKLSAYIHLNFNKAGYRENAKDIAKQIVHYAKFNNGENTIQYLRSLYTYIFCLQVPNDIQELKNVYKNAFDIWGTIPNKETHNEYIAYVNSYLTYLLQVHSEDNVLVNKLENEMYSLCEGPYVNLNTKINFFITQAQYYTNQSKYEKADSLCDVVIKEIHDNFNNNPLLIERMADAYSQKARIKYYTNDMSLADSLACLAQTTIEQLNNKNESYAKILLLRSHIKSDFGDYESAINLGQEGIQIQYNCDPEKVDPYDVIHILRMTNGEDKIYYFFLYSDLLKNTHNYNVVEGDIVKYLAEGYTEIGDYEKADSVFNIAYQLLLNNKANPIYQDENRWVNSLSTLYFSWGKSLLYQGQVARGTELLEKSVVDEMKPFLLVQMYAYQNNITKFENAARNNLDYVSDLIKNHFIFLGDHDREMYMLSVIDVPLIETESLAAVLPNNKVATQTAFNACLLHKGMSLNSYLSTKARFPDFPELETDIINLNFLQDRYTRATNHETRKALEEEIKATDKKIQRYLSANSPLLSELFIDWQQVKESLHNGEVVVEFIRYCNNDWPWVKLENKEVRYGALILKKDFDCPIFVDVLSADSINNYASANKICFSNTACESIWGKVAEYFGNNEAVYFSPIADLNAINLEAIGNLKYPNTFVRLSSSRNLCFKETTQVNEHYNTILYGGIDYKSESSLAPEYSTPQNNNLSTAIIKSSTLRGGNLEALPGTLEEIEMISKLFPQNSHVVSYSKSNATEESLKSLSSQQVSILHIATHGFAYGDNSIKDFNEPMRKCGLLMAGSQAAWSGASQSVSRKEDGILLGEEIAALALKDNDLVVLSACETGAGELSSEGVFGLQRAFKKAGANSILMSLWKVDDLSTKLFMMEFYRNYISGKSKQESLKLAQRYVREYKDENGNLLFEAPTYWASWIILDALN